MEGTLTPLAGTSAVLIALELISSNATFDSIEVFPFYLPQQQVYYSFCLSSLGGKAKSKKKPVTIKSLQSHHVNTALQGKTKITTLNLHDLLPEDEDALKNMKENKNDKL